MKKLFFILSLVLMFLICGCDSSNAKTGPFVIINNTNEKQCAYITAKNYESFAVDIEANKEFKTNIYYYNPSVKLVKDDSNIENTSNKFIAVNDGFNINIREGYSKTFTIKISNKENFESTGNYYLIEKNNKISEWSADTKK